MKPKTFKQLGYVKTPTKNDMIKSCEEKSNNMFEIHKSELRRIRTRYYKKKQLSPNYLNYLNLLYTNFVLKGMNLNKTIVVAIKPTHTVQHIGMLLFNSIIPQNKCKTCDKECVGVYCSEKCYQDND